jgi:DNA recombination protein RmuC
MDAMHWVLLAAWLGAMAGVVVLLVRRAALVARVAAAETAQGQADDRVVAAEATIAGLRSELDGVRASLREAELQATSLDAQVTALTEQVAREAREAASRREEAVKAALARADAEREGERKEHAAKVEALERAKREFEERVAQQDARMREAFNALASSALAESQKQFLALAKAQFEKHAGEAGADLLKRQNAIEQLVKPIAETLAKTETRLGEIEKGGARTATELVTRITQLQESERLLREETGNLVKALRQPQVRGRYGEMQLRRVAEIAGMRAYCDFVEQSSTRDEEGAANRPDMVVRLPNGRQIVVDAKANLQPYLDALDAKDPERVEACLDAFANGVAKTAAALGAKSYWKNYDGTPEFVVMFVPGEQLIDAALARRPDLLEEAARHNVLLAGPGSLIALLRAVHLGFREQKISEEARAIRDLVTDLHQRLGIALEKAGALQKSLNSAVKSWNEFAGSVESRLIPQVRRIEESGVKSDRTIEGVGEIDASPRPAPALPSRGEASRGIDE